MTKAEWISYITNHLKKIDETRKYHPKVVEKTIDTVHSQLFSEMYARSRKGMYKYLKTYTDTLTGDVAVDTAIEVDNPAVMLPRINGGFFDVYYKVADAGDKVLCELTGRDMFNRSVNSTYDTLGLQGKRLVCSFDEGLYFNTALSNTDAIYYTILPKFSTLSSTDEVRLPVGAEEVVADRVLDTMRLIPPVDLQNDNAD